MITINLYNFSKKTNSTKRPTGSGSAYSCAVKTGSSIINPVIEISTNTLPAYNYAYISNFKRYYFVSNIVYDRGVWVLSLNVDVLASYRPGIGSTSGFVLRASAASQPALIDTLYPPTGNSQVITDVFEYGNLTAWSTGSVVISIINGTASSGMTSYQFSNEEFRKFIAGLMGTLADSSISTWDSLTQSIKVTTYEPLRYIGAAFWFPNSFSTGANVTSLKLGNYEATGFTCNPIYTAASPRHVHYTVSIPKHPQAGRGKYLNLSPFAEYELQIPPFGTIKLDTTALMDSESIDIDCVPDPLTGMARAIITSSTGYTLADVAAQWGVPLKISSFANVSMNNAFQTAGGVASAVAGVVAGDVGTVIGGIGSTLKGVADIAKGSFDTVGSTGAIIDHQTNKVLYSRFFFVTEEDNSNNGRPYCYNKTMASLPGFLQVQKGVFTSADATRTEIDAVNSYLESGFYYE